MRFRTNIEHVDNFQRIIQAIEKLQKRCIMRFTETDMHIICNEETEDGVQVWSTIKVDSLFTEYRIQSNASNEISLLLSPSALLKALSSASTSSSDVTMKLAKKHAHAVLSFEFASAVGTGGGLGAFGASAVGTKPASVVHDVLIDVLKPTDIAHLKEPLCPEPDIHIVLPPLQKLRTVVDRMRTMADVLGIHANKQGGLRLSIESDQVRVETQWSKCPIPNMATQSSNSQTQNSEEEPEPEPDPAQWFGVHLSVRAFLKFLSSHVVSTTTIACICEDHCMILYVYIGDVQDAGGVLTFWIPARLSGVD